MLKKFKNNKRKLKYIIVSIVIITVLSLSTIILTTVNNLTRDNNDMVQIAKATENYSYSNPYIPKGFEHSEGSWNTGYVIKETATGNEFVWIPVYESNTLSRREFTKTFSSMASSSDTLDASFNNSIIKYGGYYVGRYEAGVGSTSGNNVGVPVCKKGVTVWRNISRNNAISSSQKMYQNSKELKSSLMNSYAYDTMLNWLKSNNNVDTDSSSWGNYRNSSNGSIQVAGNNAKWKANNIYDIAGNVWEWTTENYGNDAVVRGGDALSNGSVLPAGTREHAVPTNTFDYTGFRVLLFRDAEYIEKATALSIAGGISQTAYIDSNNILWMWGKNTSGEFGRGNTESPEMIPTPINNAGIKFKEIALRKHSTSSSDGYTIAISTDGYLYGWGHNAYGYIGNGYTSSTAQKISTPQKISDKEFQKISVGATHSLAIDASGNIWAWGSNVDYKTGVNKNTGYTGVPTQITSGIKFKEIATGNSHNMALDKNGKLYTWGYGSDGRLCTGKTTNVKTPTIVDTGTTTFTKIAAGFNYSLAIDNTNQLWGCGSNTYGQLGTGNTTKVTAFTRDITKTGKTFKDISANCYTSLAIDTTSNLHGWGQNNYGQLGNNTTTNALSPISILTQIKKVSMGKYFFIAVAENEDIYTCGINNYGQLGNNSINAQHKPVLITTGK